MTQAKNLYESVHVIDRDPFWRDPKKRFSAHLSLKPRDVLRSYSSEFAQLVKEISREQRFDIVIASTLDMAPYALLVPGTPCLLEEHNFSTSLMEDRFHKDAGFMKKSANWITWQKCRRYERHLYPKFIGVTMVSANDKNAVQKSILNYSGRLEVIPNGVDLETHQIGLAVPNRDTIVFNGSLTYSANLEAMKYFIQQILPLIQQQKPAARLIITGRTDAVDLTWLPGEANILLTGYLEDVRQTVAGSWIAVAPLKTGGGTRLKILEAMALGTPVVSTAKGAEGLELTHGVNFLQADDSQTFANHCIRLLNDANLREKLSINARQMVEKNYGWKSIGRKYCQFVESVVVEIDG